MLDCQFDSYVREQYGIVCGTDEAGRGPLAGPVVAAAVVLPVGITIDGLDDSKKLSEKKRERLYDEIIKTASAYGIASASESEIDEINILNASLLAMRRAVDKASEMLGSPPGIVLADGNRTTDFGTPSQCVVHGDAISPSIAAASVLAKVTRDRMCVEYDALYPEYGFAAHKGYPTFAHKLALFEFGPCPIHRRTFLSFLERDHDKLAKAFAEKESAKKARI